MAISNERRARLNRERAKQVRKIWRSGGGTLTDKTIHATEPAEVIEIGRLDNITATLEDDANAEV